jgi:MoxR-like ATPase
MRHIIANNQILQEKGTTPVTVNVEGPAGIGKTSSILQLAKELNMDLVRLNLAELEDLSDLVGFPVKEFEVVKETTVKWVPESLLPQYVASQYKPTGNKRMGYAAPEWINNKKEGGILILDDYTRADKQF